MTRRDQVRGWVFDAGMWQMTFPPGEDWLLPPADVPLTFTIKPNQIIPVYGVLVPVRQVALGVDA